MPESRSRKPKQRRGPAPAPTPSQAIKPSPSWYAPVMITLMVLGLAWVVVAYLTSMAWPIEALRTWNLAVGFGLILIGFGMTTRWK